MKKSSKSNRLVTQAQVLHRVLQVFFLLSGLTAIALTFPAARAAMGSILASAGIISLIAGIAAQGVLANMFAGLQIAFSDSIRVGDLVAVQQETGSIEEITLTYVVVRLWDERRLIMPSKKFTEEVFENWTKRSTNLLGTVELHVDWRLPLPAFHNEVDRLLSETDLWDGRTANVQVTDSSEDSMVVRLVVSAANNGDLWDLRCFMREHLIDWIQTTAPYALPRKRIEGEKVIEVEMPVDEIEVEREVRAELLASAQQKRSEREADAKVVANQASTPPTDPYGEPILDQYARKLLDKRRSWRLKARELDADVATKKKNGMEPVVPDSLPDTKLLSTTATFTSDRLYSGSPDAEARREMISGPKRAAKTNSEEANKGVSQTVNKSQDESHGNEAAAEKALPQSEEVIS